MKQCGENIRIFKNNFAEKKAKEEPIEVNVYKYTNTSPNQNDKLFKSRIRTDL